MQDADTIVERYFAAWNEPDCAVRHELIAEAWSEDAEYRDPQLSGDGHDGIEAMIAFVHEHYPGHRFQLVGPIDSHNDRLRFAWCLSGPDGGPPAFSGVDFGIVAEDRRLRSIAGFFDPAQDA